MLLKVEPQLDLFSEVEARKVRLGKFMVALEGHLSNMKYLHNQIKFGEVGMEPGIKAQNALRESQFEICKVLVKLGIKNEILKERDFNWYCAEFIDNRYSSFVRNPMFQQELYEAMYYQFNRMVTTFAQNKEFWQPFAVDSVKAIEDNLKLARTALK